MTYMSTYYLACDALRTAESELTAGRRSSARAFIDRAVLLHRELSDDFECDVVARGIDDLDALCGHAAASKGAA